jgi:hypothetical protein
MFFGDLIAAGQNLKGADLIGFCALGSIEYFQSLQRVMNRFYDFAKI